MKAIYQRYMGWFDGNPAHLWEHPPVEQARRYVEFMGGAEAVLEQARASRSRPATTAGSPRSSTTSSSPSPRTQAARELQADALEQLGYGAENATWRNFFLMGAKELREGISGTPTATAPPDILAQPLGRASCSTRWRSASTARAPGSSACGSTGWSPTPTSSTRSTVRNGVLSHRPGSHDPSADAALVVEREALERAAAAKPPTSAELAESGRLRVEGDGDEARRAARPARRARPRLRDRHPGLR